MSRSTIEKSVEFFNQVYTAYQKAEMKMGGSLDYFYQIGGFNICLSFASEQMINAVIPALEHLQIQAIQPDLKICIWDSASTGINIDGWDWKNENYQAVEQIYLINNARIHASNNLGIRSLNLLDKQRNLGIYWAQNSTMIPYWDLAAPLRVILHSWLLTKGLQYVHSAAVGTKEGGVLLVGKSGSGKSTTALSCLSSPLSYLADDYCLLHPDLKIYSLYNTGKKNADDLDRLPFLKKYISNADQLDQQKAVYFLHKHIPNKIISQTPLKAILIPKITQKPKTTIVPTSPVQAIIALAPSTIFQLPGAGKESFEIISQIVKKLNCYHLNLGTDMQQVPKVIFNLIQESL